MSAIPALISNTQFYDECFGFLFPFNGILSDGVQITVDFRLFHSEFNFFPLRSVFKRMKRFPTEKIIKQQFKRKWETMPSEDKNEEQPVFFFFLFRFLRIVLRIEVDVVVLGWNGSVSAKMKNKTLSFWVRDGKKRGARCAHHAHIQNTRLNTSSCKKLRMRKWQKSALNTNVSVYFVSALSTLSSRIYFHFGCSVQFFSTMFSFWLHHFIPRCHWNHIDNHKASEFRHMPALSKWKYFTFPGRCIDSSARIAWSNILHHTNWK